MSTVREVYRQTVTNLTTWPGNALRFARLVRPVDPPRTPYVNCAGCRKGGRDDQKVPDPDQFAKAKTTVKADNDGDPVPPPAPTKDAEIKLIDAAPVWCGTCRAWFHAIRCYSLHRHTD